MKPHESKRWVPLLDEGPEPAPITVESISKCTTADELRMCYLKVQEMPLSDVERAAMNEAIRTRASHLNISSWDFQPYDNGSMMQAAQAMQDDYVAREFSILDDTPGKPLRIRFKGSEAAVVSLNERVYLPEILTDAAHRAGARARAKSATWGEDEHPPMDITDGAGRRRFRRTRNRAVLVPENVFMEGNVVLVDARILEDTEPGRALASDIRAGRPVYFSTRAYGADLRVVPLADGRQVTVPMQMDIETWDRVRNPAIPDAKPLAVLDSVQVQAICDAVQAPARAPAAPAPTQTAKEAHRFMWTKEMVEALAKTPEGRRQLAVALGDSTIPADIRTAMTDALATTLQGAAPAAAPQVPQDVINQAVTDALNRQAEATRQAEEARAQKKTEATAYATEQIATMAGKYPQAMIDSIAQDLAGAPDKATAEVLFKQAVRLADNALVTARLTGLGYLGGANGATLNGVQVTGNPQPWKGIIDRLMESFDDFRLTSYGERPDVEVRKTNAPFVKKLLAKFDTLNARALVDGAAAWETMTDAVTTSDLWTQIVVQRALLEQAFGDADMLQFVGTDVFEGTTITVPVEYYETSGSVSHRTGEMEAMARGKVKTAWIPFTATARRIATEISNDVQRGMASGPLRYNASARALYHIMAEVRRVINIEAGNEMLRASDAYGAVAVADEELTAAEVASVTDATNVKYKVTLRRGGTSGSLTATNTDRPVVRPRSYTSFAANGQATQVVENPITLKIDGTAATMRDLRKNADGTVSIVDAGGSQAKGFAVDFENGYLYVSDDLTIVTTAGSEDTTVSYSYATNFTTFSLTPDTGVDEADHYNGLLRKIGFQAATMGAHPRYIAPNIALGSMTAMEYVINASLFYNQNSPKGTILNPSTGNFVGSRNGIDYAKHNTQWAAGDSRILLGRAMATKFMVRDPLAPKGPFPSIDPATGLALPGEQWYVEGWDTMATPEVRNQAGVTLNPYYRTIKLKA